MGELFHNIFEGYFIPHSHCYLWKLALMGQDIALDSPIAPCYYAIPLLLVYLVCKRQNVPFSWIFLLNGCFIVGCGTIKIMEISTQWQPDYWLAAFIRVIAAAGCCVAALELVPMLPKALERPKPSELETANRELENQILERASAESALKESQRMLTTLMSNLPGMAYRCRNDKDWTMEFVSEGCFSLTGYHSSEFVENRTVSYGELIHPGDRETVWNSVQKALLERKPFQIVYRIKTATGEQKWVWEQGRGVFSPNGDLCALEGFIADITGQKQAEEELQKTLSELEQRVQERTYALKQLNEQMLVQILERHQAQEELQESNQQIVRILESITDAFFALDREWRFTYVNKEAEQVLHRRREELLGQNVWDEFPEAYGSLFYQEYRQAVSEKVAVTFEAYYPPLDAWLEVRAYPSKDGLSVFFRDITQQKQALEALQRSEELYRTLARNFPNGAVFLFDSDLRYTLAEGTGLEVAGLSKEFVEGKTVYEVFPPNICEQIEPLYRVALAGEAKVFELPYANRIYLGYTLPVRNERGEVFAGMCMTQDITERKLSEEALRQSEERYALAASGGQVGVWDWNVDTGEIYGAPNLKAMLGYEDCEIPNHLDAWRLIIHPDDLQRVRETAIAHLEGVTPKYESEHRMLHKDGSIRWMLVRGTAMRDASDKSYRLAGSATDITERKQFQEQLEEITSLQRAILDSANYTIISTTADGTIRTFNAAAERWLGYAAEEVVGKKTPAIFHSPDELAQYAAELHQELGVPIETGFEVFVAKVRSGETVEREWSYVRKDGSRFPVLVSVTALRDAHNNITGFLAIGSDITYRKQAEEALRRSEARFQKLAANVPGMIYQFRLTPDGSMSFPYVSSGTREVYELEPEEVEESAFAIVDRIHPDDLQSFSESVGISARTLESWRWEGRYLAPSGVLKWFQGASKPELQENGDVLWDGVVMDISDRKKAEEALVRSEAEKTRLIESLREQTAQLELAMHELQQTQFQLIQAEKMSSIGQLVAGVAHEINNPVSFIYSNIKPAKEYISDLLGLVNLYQQHYPTPPAEIKAEIERMDLEFLMEDIQKVLESMKVGADRIRKIVESLRNFSRLDEAERKQVDLHEGIENTLFILQSRLNSKEGRTGIQVIREYGDLPLVECYASQINQVFMNILSNAIDALEEGHRGGMENGKNAQCPISNAEGPTIRICTEVLENGRVAIRIADNGPGMTEKVRSRAFDPFFTTKPIGSGTGLGLSISYQIVVEKHKGELKCISAPGWGTEFAIAIPIRQLRQRSYAQQSASLIGSR